MREDEEQRGRVLAVHDGERADLADAGAVHRRDRRLGEVGAEGALLRARKQMVAPQLDELAVRRLGERVELVELRHRRHGGNGRRGEKFTSVHEHLVGGCQRMPVARPRQATGVADRGGRLNMRCTSAVAPARPRAEAAVSVSQAAERIGRSCPSSGDFSFCQARREVLRQHGAEDRRAEHQREHDVEHPIVEQMAAGAIDRPVRDERRRERGGHLRQRERPDGEALVARVAVHASRDLRRGELAHDERTDDRQHERQVGRQAVRRGRADR